MPNPGESALESKKKSCLLASNNCDEAVDGSTQSAGVRTLTSKEARQRYYHSLKSCYLVRSVTNPYLWTEAKETVALV